MFESFRNKGSQFSREEFERQIKPPEQAFSKEQLLAAINEYRIHFSAVFNAIEQSVALPPYMQQQRTKVLNEMKNQMKGLGILSLKPPQAIKALEDLGVVYDLAFEIVKIISVENKDTFSQN